MAIGTNAFHIKGQLTPNFNAFRLETRVHVIVLMTPCLTYIFP